MTAPAPIDFDNIITRVSSAREAQTLPPGCAVGDTCGGRSFNDNIAVALERRSYHGWREVDNGEICWTVIFIER